MIRNYLLTLWLIMCMIKMPVALHDQKNKTSPVAQVASWEESLIKGEKCSTGNLDNQGVELQWPLVQKPWVLSNKGKEQDWAGRWSGPQYTQKQELQRGTLKVSVLSLLVHCEVDQWRALGRCSGRSTDLVVIIGSIEVSAVRNQLSLETIGGE